VEKKQLRKAEEKYQLTTQILKFENNKKKADEKQIEQEIGQ
jgi:hypothetical protein